MFSAPLAGYNLPLPGSQDADAPLWHQAVGYEITAVIGMLVLGLVTLGIGYGLRRREPPGRAVLGGEGAGP